MNRPLVSIIVPVYNTAEYVEECIKSILSQTYKNIELILVNDGCTDGSGDVCRRYEQDEHVRYIEQANSGVQIARKKGVEASRGKWIMFVDSDDTLPSDSVSSLLSVSDGVDIVVGRHEKPVSWEDGLCDSKKYLSMIYREKIYTAPWGKLFKGDLVRGCKQAFEHNLPRSQDYLMNLAIAQTNKKDVALLNRTVYFYRRRANSTVFTFKHNFDFACRLCDLADAIVTGEFPEREMLRMSIELRWRFYFKCLKDHDYQGDCHHPFVRDIVRRMNKARIVCLEDRLILSVSDSRAMKRCLNIRARVNKMKSRYRSLIKKVFLHK